MPRDSVGYGGPLCLLEIKGDEEILWRIEARGAVDRIRNSQTSLFGSLLQPAKLNTLVEYEALTGGDTYTLGEYMSDMRDALWSELEGNSVAVDEVLQRERALAAFLPRPPRWGSDVRAMLKSELRTIDRMAASALERSGDEMTRVHLQDVRSEIADILEGGD